MKNIEITNIELLDEKEKNTAEKLFQEYYNKIQRQIKNKEAILKVDIEEYSKGGKRKKYDIAVKIEFATNVFRSKAFDWNFSRAVHKVMNKIIGEIEHKLHVSEQK